MVLFYAISTRSMRHFLGRFIGSDLSASKIATIYTVAGYYLSLIYGSID
jgi:hypothetical protein